MLVLSRFKDEEIIITNGDDKITISVIDIRGDKVRLGFSAPSHVIIHRKEIFNKVNAKRESENTKRYNNG